MIVNNIFFYNKIQFLYFNLLFFEDEFQYHTERDMNTKKIRFALKSNITGDMNIKIA